MNGYSRRKHIVVTQKSTYARNIFSLELAPPFWREILNERLPRMGAPFSLKRGAHLKDTT